MDIGSSVDLLYYKTLAKMGLRAGGDDLQSFTGERVWPLGLIRLTVVVARVEVSTMFHVVDSPGPFTAILGRPWLDSMGPSLPPASLPYLLQR